MDRKFFFIAGKFLCFDYSVRSWYRFDKTKMGVPAVNNQLHFFAIFQNMQGPDHPAKS